MLAIGEKAPDFELMDEQGRKVSLRDFMGQQSVVLMFYPADSTPGCTAQMCAARDDYDRYQAAGVAVFGVNPGSEKAHQRFAEKNQLRTPLLLDEGGKISKAYDALMPIPILTVVNRTVVGIDAEGNVAFYQRGMPSTDTILRGMGKVSASP